MKIDYNTGTWKQLGYAAIVSTVVLGFLYVRFLGVNVLWADDWDLVPMMSQYHDGNLTFQTFWQPHNEHRLFFPRLLILAIGSLTQFSSVANMYCNVAILSILLIIYLYAFRHLTQKLSIWCMIPVAFLVFSLRQWENILWGHQITFVLTAASAAGTFLLLSRIHQEGSAWKFLAGMATATVAAYSAIQGLIVWPVGLAQLLIAPLSKRQKITLSLLWGTVGLAEWCLYFQNCQTLRLQSSLGFSLSYLLAVLGGSLWGDQYVAPVLGALLLIFAAILLRPILLQRLWSRYSFELATLLYALATMLAIDTGRSSDYGIRQAVTSRYATFSIPFLIASYALMLSLWCDNAKGISIRLIRCVSLTILVSVSLCFVVGIGRGYSNRIKQETQQLFVCTLDSQPDDANQDSYKAAKVRRYSAILKKMHYNVFAEKSGNEGQVASKTSEPSGILR